MKRFLPRATSALSSSILAATLFISPVAGAEGYVYKPSMDFGSKFSKGRNIHELNYMQPLFSEGNLLPIIDVKVKFDNQKSKEINLGAVLRHNYQDKAILGTYAYFDHRQTASKFSVSSLTAGAEILSKYIDARVNIYIPQKKTQKIADGRSDLMFNGTSMFALYKGDRYETAPKGYDIEIGTPIFAFSDSLNEKIGTKIHVAHYSFKGKNTKSITGIRFRLEQDIAKVWSGNNSFNFYMNAETQYDKVRKRQNFVGVGVKIIFNDKENSDKKDPNSLRHRMMDRVVRDVDTVISTRDGEIQKLGIYADGKIKTRRIYLGSFNNGANHNGDGSIDNPYSFQQLENQNLDDAVVIYRQGDKELTSHECIQMQRMTVLNNRSVAFTTDKGETLIATGSDSNGIQAYNTDGKGPTLVLLEANEHKVATEDLKKWHTASTVLQAIRRMKVAKAKYLALPPHGTIIPREVNPSVTIDPLDINRVLDTLTPDQSNFYNILRLAPSLIANGPGNKYIARQRQFDQIKELIQDNPGANRDEIIGRYDLLYRRDRNDYVSNLARALTVQSVSEYEVTGGAGEVASSQQGMSSGENFSRIISMEELRKLYGTLDGDQALNLIERFAILAIKENVTGLANATDEQIKQAARTAIYRNITPEYREDRDFWLNRQNPQGARADALRRIKQEVVSSNTTINKYLAAFRAIEDIRADRFTHSDRVMPRYNEKEVLAYTIYGILDNREIETNYYSEKFTPAKILDRQKSQIDLLLTSLGDVKRAYNKDADVYGRGGMPIMGGTIDIGNDPTSHYHPYDYQSCNHGATARISNNLAAIHSKVKISNATPGSFSDEFNDNLKKAVAKLGQPDKNSIIQWIDDIVVGNNITITYVNRRVTFAHPDPYPIPPVFAETLTKVAEKLDTNYSFTHPERWRRYVSERGATDVFKNIVYIDFN